MNGRRTTPRWLAAFAVLILAACTQREPAQPAFAGPIALGHYRATLTLPGGELPFGLELVQEDGAYVAYLINGPERVRVSEVTVSGDRVEMIMPGFQNTLSAKIDGPKLTGTVILVKRGGVEQKIPFAAQHGVTYRFLERPATDNADLSGRWAVTFTEESGRQYPAVGEFKQQHHQITGTFLTPTGDHRYLAGDVRDEEFALSTFDGAHAYLYRGRIRPDGQLEGTFWSGLAWKESFTARRDDNASLGEAASVTALRNDTDRLDFTFPDLDGTQVSLSDPRFAGKVVVVALGGSWCPNCHDEAAFLAPWYRENRDRGVEVIALMFEHFGDFPQAAAATQRMREKFGIEYTTLIAGISDKDDAAKRLPQLNGVYAFPTTLFIDRAGRVRRIHTGFSGPATGEHHRRLIEEFDATVEQLLAEEKPT
ncbi:MAG TPA: TlpA disulfide reductase family protein [Steroidobacteraceae bacterium]